MILVPFCIALNGKVNCGRGFTPTNVSCDEISTLASISVLVAALSQSKSIINPQRMFHRVIVVVSSVCLCVCLCGTANLGIYAGRHQMMGTNGISRVW